MNVNHYKIGLFVPCDIDQFSPDTAWKALRLLEKLGMEVFYPIELTGSGMELYQQGDMQTAKQLGEKMIEAFSGCDYVVSLSSATVAYAQKHFPSLFRNTTMHNEYRGFIEHFLDFSDFLANIVHYTPNEAFAHKVAFMDNCQTLNDYRSPSHPETKGLRDEPRQLLASVPELTLVEMEQNDLCCGYGGLFANHFTKISDKLAETKIANATTAGADYIVSTEMGCLLNLRSYALKHNIKIGFAHLADLM